MHKKSELVLELKHWNKTLTFLNNYSTILSLSQDFLISDPCQPSFDDSLDTVSQLVVSLKMQVQSLNVVILQENLSREQNLYKRSPADEISPE